MAGYRAVVLLLVGAVAAFASSPPEVTVNTGTLRGKWTQSDSGRAIAAFEGIPYAQPPVGELRFKAPVPAQPWTGVRMADKPSSRCLQRLVSITGPQTQNFAGSEDCLYLNVYAPETVSRDKPLPVLFYIHGGAFRSGEGHLYGPELLLDRDVILVNINLRLGPLGFFSTGDDVIRGNFGMKDIVQALRWVRQNIRAFGGNPELVTIIGESSGGTAVNLMMMSPMSRGLFHRVISMSGTALAPWAVMEQPLIKVQVAKLAKAIGCSAETSQTLKQCLMTKTAEQIQGVDVAFMDWDLDPIVPFQVVIESSGLDAFLDRHPSKYYSAGQVADVPFMTGVTSDEGCLLSARIIDTPAIAQDLDKRWQEVAPIIFYSSNLPARFNTEIYSKVRAFYLGDKALSRQTGQGLTDLITDAFFSVSAQDTAKHQKKVGKSPVFFYDVTHKSDRSFATLYGAKNNTWGVCHSDDLMYLFPLRQLFPQQPSESDKAFSNYMIDLFTTFAVQGKPTKDGSWAEMKQTEYAELSQAGSVSMHASYFPERMQLWQTLPVNVAIGSPKDILQ